MTPQFSLVIPLHNEAGNLLPLLEETVRVLTGLSAAYEIILVNDGSSDATADEIAIAVSRWPECRALHHPRNLGQAVALLAGLREAKGQIILTMDGDGQNDPRDFPALITPVLTGGYHVMCGWRTSRHDPWVRRQMSRLANGVRRRVLRDGVHDAGCQLRVMRREVVDVLFPFELLQSFLPAIAVAAGLKVGEKPVRHHARIRGQAHYGPGKLWWRPAVAMFRLRRKLQR